MTTINDINDFARIIREQPEWGDSIRSLLLSQELLELPVRHAEFVELAYERMERLETALAELADQTSRNFQLAYERMERLETALAELADQTSRNFQLAYERMERLETALAELADQTSRNFQLVYERLERLETDSAQIKTDMNIVKGRLDNAIGKNYEFEVQKSIGGVVGSQLRRVRVLKGLPSGPSLEFMDLLDDAEENGVITAEQYMQIQVLDLVLTGRRKTDNAYTYVAAEVSITVGNSDIVRAARRAEILSAVVGQPVTPAVIGAYIDATRTTLANASNVAIFLKPDD